MAGSRLVPKKARWSIVPLLGWMRLVTHKDDQRLKQPYGDEAQHLCQSDHYLERHCSTHRLDAYWWPVGLTPSSQGGMM